MSATRCWQILQWTLFLCILVMLATVIAHYSSQLITLRFNFRYLALFLFVALLCILFRAFLIGEVTSYFGVKLRLSEMLALTIVSTTLSETLPMSAGTLIKPGYLWRVHGLNVTASMMMVITSSIMLTAGSSFLAIIGLIWVGQGYSVLTGLFAALTVLALLPFFVYPRSLAERLGPRFAKVFAAWRQIHDNPRKSGQALGIAFALCTLDAVRFWLAFLLIGSNFSFPGALIAAGTASFMSHFGIVPGALGFIEASVAGVSVLLGYSAINGLAAALVFRASILLFTVPSTPVFYFKLLKAVRQRSSTQ